MAIELFKLVGSIFVDNEEANKSISKTDEKAEGVGKTFANGLKTAGKWAAGIVAGAAAVATAVGGVAAKTVSAYADYEQLIGGVETLYGNAYSSLEEYAKGLGISVEKAAATWEDYQKRQQTVLDNAQQAYKTTGMSANEYMEMVTGFAASLNASLGEYAWQSGNYAQMIAEDISDNANKMGTDMESIKNAYAGFAKGQFNMLDNLKLGYGGTKSEMERLLRKAEELEGLKVGSLSVDNFADIATAIHAVQEELGITGTTAREATSTISGSIGMLKAKFEDFKTNIGGSVAPVVQSFLSLAIEYLPTIETMIGQITPVISDLMTQLLPPLMSLVSSLLPMAMQLIKMLLPIVTQILASVLPVIIQLLKTLLPPLIEIVQLILPPLLQLLVPILDLLSPIIELLEPILDLVIELIKPLMDLINQILTPLIAVVVLLVGKALEPLKSILVIVANTITGAFSSAVSYMSEQVSHIISIFQNIIDFVKNVFTGNWKGAWENVKNIFQNIADGIGSYFKLPINIIIGAINGFIRGLNKIKIPDWVPGVGGKGFNIKEIPALAEGAVLEKGQTGFLEGNGAEAVVPLHNNKKWISAVAQDMGEAGIGGGGEKIVALLASILSILEELFGMGIYLDGKALVGHLAGPMDKKLGQIAAMKARA